jgi:hypothetical protein
MPCSLTTEPMKMPGETGFEMAEKIVARTAKVTIEKYLEHPSLTLLYLCIIFLMLLVIIYLWR